MSEMMQGKLEKEMVRTGKTLINQLFVLIKTAQNYDIGHSALNTPASNLMKTIKEIHRRNEEASIRIHSGYILLGEVRLKPDAAGIDAFMFTIGELRRYYVGGINFKTSVRDEEIKQFAYIFRDVEPIPSPQTFEKLNLQLQKRNIAGIELESQSEEEKSGEDEADVKDSKVRAKKVYLQTVHAAAEVMDNAKMGQTLRLRKSKRVVQGMVDQLLAAETSLVGLTTIRSHDEYTYNHSVNVCILSLAIGQRVGLTKSKLCELGMAALFHDIGKADVPLAVLNKPTEFSKEEWEVMQKHPILGVSKLLKLKGLDALSARITVGAFEHHLNYDFSGYPKVPYKNLSLFGRIISIADCYDGLTSSRVYSRVPYPPDKALKFMMQRAGKAYDPILMKLFINCIGVYPVGSLLLLNTRELAVVTESNSAPEKWNTPKVLIITDSDGNAIEAETADLSDPNAGRQIIETLDPKKYKIDVSWYFL